MNTAHNSGYVVFRPQKIKSHNRGSGARTTPLVSPSTGETTFINGITDFEPGAAVAFHSHNCVESVTLLSGQGCFDVDGITHELQPFDTTFIAANIPHRFRNLSLTEPMKILWIYARTDATRTMVATGETHPIAIEHR